MSIKITIINYYYFVPVVDEPGTLENAAKCEYTNGNVSSVNGISMGYEPKGDGLYRDPLEVLGSYSSFF